MKANLIPLTLLLACACGGEHTTQAAAPKSAPPTAVPSAPETAPRPGTARVDTPPAQPSAAELDRALETRIRQALAADAELAAHASAVTVTAENGAITLRGSVASAEAKDALLAKIKALPGVVTCDDQLEVKL